MLASDNQHRHHQTRRDILILFVARLSSRSSRHKYDKLAEVEAGAIVEHKHLAHVLRVAQALQAQRDDWRMGSPSRTNHGVAVRAKERAPGTKRPLEFTQADLNAAIEQLAQQNMQAHQPPRKPARRSARPPP